MRKAIAVVCVGGAIAIVAVDVAIVAPYALTRQPGPANPSFAWYMTYHMIPVTSTALIVLLLLAAWMLWRGAR